MHPERVPSFHGVEHASEHRARRKTVEHEEARAWSRFYRRCGDVELASEVLALLESEADARREHPALVLLCRESLRRHKAWQQRRKHLARMARWLAGRLVVAPALALRRWATCGIDLAIECLRTSPGDSSRARVRPFRSHQDTQRTSS